MNSINKQKLAGVMIALVFCVVGFYTITDYGLTIDFKYHFCRGEAYLHYFLTGDTDFSRVPPNQRCRFQNPTFKELLSGKEIASLREGSGHPSLAGLLSAMGCEIFYKNAHLLGDVDAHHAMYVILSSLAILVVYLFALEAFNFPIALLSAVFFAIFPRFIGDAHNNPKDIPVLCFLVFTCWAAWKGINQKSWKWMILTGIFYGLSLAVKLSGFYIPFILLLWFTAVWNNDRTGFSFKDHKAFWTALILIPLISLLVSFLLWPYLWFDLGNIFVKLKGIFSGYLHPWRGRDGGSRWGSPPIYAFITTPVPVLILGGIGLIYACKRWKNVNKPYLLIVAWFIGPILAFSLAKFTLYDGIRHFESYIPPLCILSGIGSYQLIEFLNQKMKDRFSEPFVKISGGLLILGAVISILVPVIQIHPFQTTYFNFLIGGLKGAQQLHIPDATDYWGNSLRVAIRWINNNVEKDSLLLTEYWFAFPIVEAEGELRPDIKSVEFRPDNFQNIVQQHNGHCYSMFIYQRGLSCETYWYSTNLKPFYVLESEGAPLVVVYKIK